MMSSHTAAYLDEEEVDDGPWFCLTCKPYFCIDCQKTQRFLHISLPKCNPPPIVIFDKKDDEVLLESAIRWQERGKNPKIVDYHPDMGLSITVYDVKKIVGM